MYGFYFYVFQLLKVQCHVVEFGLFYICKNVFLLIFGVLNVGIAFYFLVVDSLDCIGILLGSIVRL